MKIISAARLVNHFEHWIIIILFWKLFATDNQKKWTPGGNKLDRKLQILLKKVK